MKARILWVTRTAVFIALLIVLQYVTVPLGNTLVTGAVVNLILIVAVMTCGIWSGLTVALTSPLLAFFFGIGAVFFPVVPFVMAGNAILVTLWHHIGRLNIKGWLIPHMMALAAAAGAKCLWLYFGIVRFAVPVLDFPKALVAAFGVSQLITACTGGALAIFVLPVLRKAVFRQTRTD
ncbi:MAG: hypothetical protein FWF99_07235 [Desulfovibrionaceae bacterium]|nr:hypothetical protein [Desulfovibrionaceae bacterium]